MALSSLNDAETAFFANADYRSSGSASKALLYAEACEVISVMRASSASQEGRTVQFDAGSLKEYARSARAYASQVSDGGVRHFDFNTGGFRG